MTSGRMTQGQLIDHLERQAEELTKRWNAISPQATADLSAQIQGHPWSFGQMLEHLRLSEQPYKGPFENLLKGLPAADPGSEFRHTFMAKQVIKAAGPRGNAPVPGQFKPGGGPYPESLKGFLTENLDCLSRWIREARGKDLVGSKMAWPAVPLFKFNVGDVLVLMADHLDRHIGQMERGLKTS